MPHNTEEKGITPLMEKLTKLGRSVSRSKNKTFDLKVNGEDAEVKTKKKARRNIDFISLTDKQFEAVQNKDFKIYLVCNVEDEENIEFYEMNSKDLRELTHKSYTSYEYNKSELDKINMIKL